jgi:hypothetical protein
VFLPAVVSAASVQAGLPQAGTSMHHMFTSVRSLRAEACF